MTPSRRVMVLARPVAAARTAETWASGRDLVTGPPVTLTDAGDGDAGVYFSFLRHAEAASERYGADLRTLLMGPANGVWSVDGRT